MLVRRILLRMQRKQGDRLLSEEISSEDVCFSVEFFAPLKEYWIHWGVIKVFNTYKVVANWNMRSYFL